MEILNSMECLVIEACRVKTTLEHETETVIAHADNLGKSLCAKIFSMCFGSCWIPSYDGGVSGIMDSPGGEPKRITEVHILSAYLHWPTRNLGLHRMIRALKERDDDDFYQKNRVLIETIIKDWKDTAVRKLKKLVENNGENTLHKRQEIQVTTKASKNEDLFDDEDNKEEEPKEPQPTSELDKEIQIYFNLTKNKYLEWRNAQSIPEHNAESVVFRLFWEHHKFSMPILSKIALKVK